MQFVLHTPFCFLCTVRFTVCISNRPPKIIIKKRRSILEDKLKFLSAPAADQRSSGTVGKMANEWNAMQADTLS